MAQILVPIDTQVIDNQEVVSISVEGIARKIFEDKYPSAHVDDMVELATQWVIHHKKHEICKRIRKEYEPKLTEAQERIPLNDESFLDKVFSRPGYKNRDIREKELEESLNEKVSDEISA